MIINFSISNFGSIKDKQTLSFEATKSTDLEDYYIIPVNGFRLLKFGLIYGANASGKTTVLKAIDFLRDLVLKPAEKKTEPLDFNPFLFDSASPNQNSSLSIDFIQNNTRYYYEVTFNKHAIVEEKLNCYKPNKANVFKRTTDSAQQFTEIRFNPTLKADKQLEKALTANTLWNNTVLGGFLKTNIELPELKDVTDWFSNYLKPFVSTTTRLDSYVSNHIAQSEINKNTVVDILKKADFNISDILINKEEKDIPNEFMAFLESQIKEDTASKGQMTKIKDTGKVVSMKIEFEHTINDVKYPLAFKLESQGTQRYYSFAGLLSMLINGSIAFPIDELEASLHPDLFVHFIVSLLINVKQSQVIATTHNRDILNNKDIFRNDAIWFTEKNAFGATELFSLADFDTKIIRDTTNIYRAYTAGKLGAVPNLGDNYINKDNEGK